MEGDQVEVNFINKIIDGVVVKSKTDSFDFEHYFPSTESCSDTIKNSRKAKCLLPLKCQFCDYKSTGTYSYIRVDKHTVKEHPVEASNLQCDICQKQVKYLHCHILEQHSPDSEKNYKCQTCGKSFYFHGQYRKHVITHSTMNPFKCDNNCGFETKYAQNLKLHVDSKRCHVKDYRFTHRTEFCNLCNVKVENLSKHLESPKSKCNVLKKRKMKAMMRQNQPTATVVSSILSRSKVKESPEISERKGDEANKMMNTVNEKVDSSQSETQTEAETILSSDNDLQGMQNNFECENITEEILDNPYDGTLSDNWHLVNNYLEMLSDHFYEQ